MLALFLSPVYLAFNGYILLWLYAWADSCFWGFHSLLFRIPVTVLYCFLALSPLTGLLVTKEPYHHALKVISNYWLGMLQYILITVLLFDAIRRITGHSFLMKYRYPAMLHAIPKNLVIFGGIAVFLVLAISLYGIFHARTLKTTHYTVTVNKSSPMKGLRIALLADLHLGYNSTEKGIRHLVDTVNSQNPDLVCITGDFFDNEYDAIINPDTVAEILSEINCPLGVYGCWGNHDVSEKILAGFTFPSRKKLVRDPRFEEFLSSANIRILEDEGVLIRNAFYLAGRKDPEMVRKEQDSRLSVEKLVESADPALPVIVMDHQPKELSASADAGVDLLLSGHTHAGQLFPASIPVHFIWENSCGVLKKRGMTSVVTSGAGVWGPAMRVGTDSEIVILDVDFEAAP